MSRESITRCTCERCPHQEEIPASFFTKYPASWEKIQNRYLCPKCVREFKVAFSKFMAEGKVRK